MRINILKSMQLNQIIEMIYMKNNGEISKRRVKVLSVEGNTFKAYCFNEIPKGLLKLKMY